MKKKSMCGVGIVDQPEGFLALFCLEDLFSVYQTSVVVVIDGKACEKNKYHMEPVNIFAQPVKKKKKRKAFLKWPVKKRVLPFKKNVTVSLFTSVTFLSPCSHDNILAKCRHSSFQF